MSTLWSSVASSPRTVEFRNAWSDSPSPLRLKVVQVSKNSSSSFSECSISDEIIPVSARAKRLNTFF